MSGSNESPNASRERRNLVSEQQATSDFRQTVGAPYIANLLECTDRHARRLADTGLAPPGFKVGVLRRWRKAEIDAWFDAGCPSMEDAE